MAVKEMQFEKELETYEKNRDRLVAESEGKYVVIRGDEIAGVWSTYPDALAEGYKRYKLEPFLVRRIEGVETILSFSRDFSPCQQLTER